MATTNINDIITIILAGGLLGTIGQGIRIVVGLKKLDDKRNSENPEKETFTLNRFLISLFIGFTAGAMALLIKSPLKGDLSNDLIFAIIAAGYSGADFIEGIFNTYFKKITTTTVGNGGNGGNGGAGGAGGTGGTGGTVGNGRGGGTDGKDGTGEASKPDETSTTSRTTTSGELPARF